MNRITKKTIALLGLALAGCHECDLCCNVGGPCGAYSMAGRGNGPAPGTIEMSAPTDAPIVPQNTTGAKPAPKPAPKPMSMHDSTTSQTWR